MAGAVSAGAYTGGVMDYLLETLDLWEKAKQRNRALGKDHPDYDHSIPMHDIEIDVMSGASAGGITAALTMLNFADADYRPVNKDNPDGKDNRYYQSWVEMADDEKSNTLEKMLKSDDLKKGDIPNSLLNAKALEEIAQKAIKVDNPKEYPSYVSEDLDVIMTSTNLRGVNFRVGFKGNYKNAPIITNHGGYFRYRLENHRHKPGIPVGNDTYFVLSLNNKNHLKRLQTAALSTAAFPVGLPSREIEMETEYIQRYKKHIFGDRKGITTILPEEPLYKFNSVDGGLINNEPFGVGIKILAQKNSSKRELASAKKMLKKALDDRYAVIMIDPLPSSESKLEYTHSKPNLKTVALGMLGTLRNQVMFNQDGIFDALDVDNYTNFLIEPVRKENQDGKWVRTKNSDLASSPFHAFSGFIDRSFRHHDFHLGRLNCQDFLRYYLTIPAEQIKDKLGVEPHDEAFDRFFIYESGDETNGGKLFPIIPDIRVLKARTGEVDTATYGPDATLAYPKFPTITEEYFNKKYEKAIRNRIISFIDTYPNYFRATLIKLIIKCIRVDRFIRNKVILDSLKNGGLIK